MEDDEVSISSDEELLTALMYSKRKQDEPFRLFIQLIDFLAVKRRPDPVKFFARFWRPTATERARLAEHVADPAWMEAPEEEVRKYIAQTDRDGDGMLNEDEYLELLRKERLCQQWEQLIAGVHDVSASKGNPWWATLVPELSAALDG